MMERIDEFAENIGDSEYAQFEQDEVTLIERTNVEKTQNQRVSASSKAAGKRKETVESSDRKPRQKVQKFLALYALAFDSVWFNNIVFSFSIEFPSAKELKDSADCHFVVTHVTPPSWKRHLKEISLEKLCDIHDKAYMRQAVLDYMLNNITRKLMSTLSKARAYCDAIWEREDLDKNPLVLDMRAEIETLQGHVDGLYSEYSRLRTATSSADLQELIRKLLEDVQNISEELAEYINSPSWNRPAFYFDDDDDEESSIPVRDIISELPLCVAITHDLPMTTTLIMGDGNLATIPETESDELIKSSVENLVPIPSESEDFSDIESECDVLDVMISNDKLFNVCFQSPLWTIQLVVNDESSHERIRFSSLIHVRSIESLCPQFPIPVEDSDSLREEIDIFPDRNKIYDPRICIKVESTRFLATFSPVIDTLLSFSSKNKDKVFNHGVLASKEKSPPSSSHRGFKLPSFFIIKGRHDNILVWGILVTDIQKKDKNEAKTDKTKHGMEKREKVKVKAESESEEILNGPTLVSAAKIQLMINLADIVLVRETFLKIFNRSEICGNDAYYGYDCPPQVLFVYNQDPCYNQDYDEFPQTLLRFQQQILCCENCGGPHATFECQSMNQNFHDFGFDQFQPPQSPVIHQPPQEMSMEAFQAREDLTKSIENFLKKFNRISFQKTPKVLMQAWDKFLEIKHAQFEDVQELLNKLVDDVRNVNEELAEYSNTPSWNLPNLSYDDDDDEESSIPLKDIIMSKLPPVENFVQNPSESEDECECDVPDCNDSQRTNFLTFSNPLFDDSTSCDDESSHEEVIHEMNFKTYSNPLFDLDEEINSSEFNPTHNEDLDSTPKDVCFEAESYLLESLVNRDALMASPPKIDFLLDEFAGKLTRLKPIPPGIDNINLDPEGDILFLESLLYDNSSPRPPEAFQANSNTIIESLPVSVDSLREEIDILHGPDDSIPPGIENDDFDLEDDDNSTYLPEFESFHVDYPNSRDSTIDVVEDIPMDVPNFLPTHPTL
ncbi:hypothetical protein Tco_1505383 [Tanacetum coccineum]